VITRPRVFRSESVEIPLNLIEKLPSASVNPANHALELKSLLSKGNLDKLVFRHLLRLSMALYKASILGVRK
jgi:hypothetical protein